METFFPKLEYTKKQKKGTVGKQTGILRFRGKIGDDVYYHHPQYGDLVRKKTSVNAERINTDPAFANVRDNNNEFRQGAQAVKLIRAAFRPLYQAIADIRMTSRVTRAVVAVIKSDATSTPGNRTLAKGDLTLLQNLEFNINASLKSTLITPFTTTTTRKTGISHITIPQLNPRKMLHAPAGATHFRLIAGTAEINFETGTYTLHTTSTTEIPLKNKTLPPQTLTTDITKQSKAAIIQVLRIEFLQQTKSQKYTILTNSSHNALSIVHVEPALPIKPTPITISRNKRSIPQRIYSERRRIHSHPTNTKRQHKAKQLVPGVALVPILSGRDGVARRDTEDLP
jgi:hypothetical protein